MEWLMYQIFLVVIIICVVILNNTYNTKIIHNNTIFERYNNVMKQISVTNHLTSPPPSFQTDPM